MTNTIETLLSRNLLAVFGELDALKRRAAIAEIWIEDGVFSDSHGRYVGQEALNEAVGKLHERFPGFVFTAIGSPQTIFGAGRLGWGYGPAAAESPKVTGEDVITVRDGRIASLYSFIDSQPTG